MTDSEHEAIDPYGPSEAIPLDRARWYGSLRLLHDGRMRFSHWSYKGLPHVTLQVVTDGKINVYSAGLAVMYLYPLRNRILSACFPFTLKVEQLRSAVAELRDARGGLDSWVIPALEMSYPQVMRINPDVFKVIPELLASCRGLPVARQWQRVRTQYFKNQGVSPPELPGDTQPGASRRGRPRLPTHRRNASGQGGRE
jgi:hypothetical protein